MDRGAWWATVHGVAKTAAAAVAPGAEPSLGAVLAAASYLQIPDLVALCKKRLKRHGKYCHLRGGGGGCLSPEGDCLQLAISVQSFVLCAGLAVS